VDDAESECGLDGREWDVVVDNGAELEKLDEYDVVLSSLLAASDSVVLCAAHLSSWY
jgi:hypothetical protein